jgi:diguanylate cyclase (GGDEF)-like protein
MTRLTRWFSNLPIEHKLNAITSCVVLAALLPIVGVMLGYEYHMVRLAAVQEIQVQANIIRDNTAAALAFRDQTSAIEVLDSLRASSSVTQAVLTLPDGSIFARYIREGPTLYPELTPPQSDGEAIAGNNIQISRSVHLKSQAVGWLMMESSLDKINARIQLYALFIVLSTLIAMGLARWLARRLIASITRPLSRLVDLTHNVAVNEDYTLRATTESLDEIGELSQAFNTMLSHIHDRDMRLNQLAYRDNVTGLTNRHYFKERAEEAVTKAIPNGSHCGLMFIDLDRFKAVNDTLGHDVGDELLQVVAQRLSSLLRKSDVVCRIGGDEFAVILEDVKEFCNMTTIAQKMVHALAQVVPLRGHEVFIGASIGISVCPDNASSMSELLRCADVAMYQAKSLGRGQFCIYKPEMDHKMPPDEPITPSTQTQAPGNAN